MMLSTDFQEITAHDICKAVNDSVLLSHYTLIRLYQKGVSINGENSSFSLVLGYATNTRAFKKAISSRGGAMVGLRLVIDESNGWFTVVKGFVIHGIQRHLLQRACELHKVSVWANLMPDTHNLLVYANGLLSSYAFPKGLDDTYLFDPQVFHDAISSSYGKPISFVYVPVGYFDSLALRSYRKAIVKVIPNIEIV